MYFNKPLIGFISRCFVYLWDFFFPTRACHWPVVSAIIVTTYTVARCNRRNQMRSRIDAVEEHLTAQKRHADKETETKERMEDTLTSMIQARACATGLRCWPYKNTRACATD